MRRARSVPEAAAVVPAAAAASWQASSSEGNTEDMNDVGGAENCSSATRARDRARSVNERHRKRQKGIIQWGEASHTSPFMGGNMGFNLQSSHGEMSSVSCIRR